MITNQPSSNSFSLSILNAHEFVPHPKVSLLIPLDMLLIKEQEGIKGKNVYNILTKDGKSIFWAIESFSCCRRLCCGRNKTYYVKIQDETEETIIEMRRPYRCGSVCCCLQELFIYSPPGNLIGTIQESCNFFFPQYQIFDSMKPESAIFNVKVPFCTWPCLCGDVDFPVESTIKRKKQENVGIITKKWRGVLKELFADADTFGVSFPVLLDPKHKVLFLCACLFIDFLHYERDN